MKILLSIFCLVLLSSYSYSQEVITENETVKVFSENYTCVLNKWFDTLVEKPVFDTWERDGDNFLRNGGRKYSIMFEDETSLTLINSRSRFDINTIIINKENKKITTSLTMDDQVIVLKGYCE